MDGGAAVAIAASGDPSNTATATGGEGGSPGAVATAGGDASATAQTLTSGFATATAEASGGTGGNGLEVVTRRSRRGRLGHGRRRECQRGGGRGGRYGHRGEWRERLSRLRWRWLATGRWSGRRGVTRACLRRLERRRGRARRGVRHRRRRRRRGGDPARRRRLVGPAAGCRGWRDDRSALPPAAGRRRRIRLRREPLIGQRRELSHTREERGIARARLGGVRRGTDRCLFRG